MFGQVSELLALAVEFLLNILYNLFSWVWYLVVITSLPYKQCLVADVNDYLCRLATHLAYNYTKTKKSQGNR